MHGAHRGNSSTLRGHCVGGVEPEEEEDFHEEGGPEEHDTTNDGSRVYLVSLAFTRGGQNAPIMRWVDAAPSRSSTLTISSSGTTWNSGG